VLDLFKKCHYSKKNKGYTSVVQLAIVRHHSKKILSSVFILRCLMIMNHVCLLHVRTKGKICGLHQVKVKNPCL
jgi:hypothetical protein